MGLFYLPIYCRLPSAYAVNSVLVICSITGVIALACVSLRIYTRWKLVRNFGMDDWLMLIAMVFFGIYCVSVCIAAKSVQIVPVIPLQHVKTGVNFLNVAEMFYLLTIIVLKLSIGIFFLRIVHKRKQQILIYTAMFLNTIFGLASFGLTIFQCGTYKDVFIFILRRLGDQCISDATALGMTFTHAALTTITDWVFLVLPIFVLKGTRMEKREKITVCCILAFASISGIASIIRFPYIKHFAGPKDDFFAGAANIAIWSCLEPGIGIIAGCLVTLRPLVRRFLVKVRSSGYPSVESDNSPLPSFVKPNLERDAINAIKYTVNNSNGNANTQMYPSITDNGGRIQANFEDRNNNTSTTNAKKSQKKHGKDSGFGLMIFGTSFGRSFFKSRNSAQTSSSRTKTLASGSYDEKKSVHSVDWDNTISPEESNFPSYGQFTNPILPQASHTRASQFPSPKRITRPELPPYSQTSTQQQQLHLQPQQQRHLHQSLRSLDSRNFSKPLPPLPSSPPRLRSGSYTQRSTFRSGASNEPGLPLYLFQTQYEDNEDDWEDDDDDDDDDAERSATTRSSWLDSGFKNVRSTKKPSTTAIGSSKENDNSKR